MAKLSNLLKKHDSYQSSGDNTPAVIGEVREMFPIPADEGQSIDELIEESGPGYMRACMEMANRALSGNVNPMLEGDLPHKMALLLLHKLSPSRKWNGKLSDDKPAEVKKTARALKSLIKSLSEDGEVIIDSTPGGMQLDKDNEVQQAGQASAAGGRE